MIEILKYKSTLSFLFATTIILFYTVITLNNSLNYPFGDDYNAILVSLNKFLTEDNYISILRGFFAQHNEHRIAFNRLVNVLQYYLFDEVNFKHQIIFGNIALLSILLFVFNALKYSNECRVLLLVPMSLFLFNISFNETSIWAMAAIQNLWGLNFVLISLFYLFREDKGSIFKACIVGFIATYTSANGMMLFISGSLIFFIRGELLSAKSIKWVSFGAVMIVVYFIGYEKPSHHPGILDSLTHPIRLAIYFFTFLGGATPFKETLAPWLGMFLFFIYLYLTKKKYYELNPVLYSFITFILISAGIAGLARSGFGVEQALSSRYSICSTLFILCVLVALIECFQTSAFTKHGFLVFFFIAVMFNGFTFSNYYPVMVLHSNFMKSKSMNPSIHEVEILKTSDSLGVYHSSFIERNSNRK